MSDLNSEIDLIDSDREMPNVNNARIAHYKHLDDHIQTDLGLYRDIRINSYQPSKTEGRLLRLIYYDDIKRKFEVDESTLSLFQRYAAYEIAFVSIIGEKGNGKSFIFDKVLNLSGVRGNHLSVNREKGIFVWSQPFRKRNLKIFLLDCQGFKSQGLSLHEAKIHTMLMLLSSVVLFNHKSKVQMDDSSTFQSLVQNSFSTSLYNQRPLTKQDQILTRCAYHLVRTPSSVTTNHQLIKYFSQYEFTFLEDAMAPNYKGKDSDLIQCSFLTTSCVNEKYIRHIAEIFQSVLVSVEEKTICGVTINGNIVCKLLNHMTGMLSRENTLDIDRLFKSIIQQLYVSAYNFCVISYSDVLEKELKDQQPKGFEQLLQILGKAQDQTMAKYHQFNLDPQLHRLYLRKLQQHIDLKQKLILEINEKKTQNFLKEFKLQPAQSTEIALRNLQRFNSFHPELDHGREQILVEFCQYQLDGAIKNLGNYQLQKQLQKNEGEVAILKEQLALVRNKTRGVKEQFQIASQQLLKEKKKEEQLLNKLQGERVKLNQISKSKVTASLNIDQVRSHFEPIVMQNEQKIGKMKSDLAALTSKKPTVVNPQDLNAFKKEIDELTKKQQDLRQIVGIQQEQIKTLTSQIDAKNKPQSKAPPAKPPKK